MDGRILSLVSSWLPRGKKEANDWVAYNPNRADRHLGSFRVNLENGKWADFAVQDAKGNSLASLAVYVFGISPKEAYDILRSRGLGQ